MNKKTVRDIDVKGKKVLVRCDFNVPLDENKNIIPLDDSIYQAKYLSDISFSKNDYTLNTLLTLLPKKIYIHLLYTFTPPCDTINSKLKGEEYEHSRIFSKKT